MGLAEMCLLPRAKISSALNGNGRQMPTETDGAGHNLCNKAKPESRAAHQNGN
jgi:hypothetical protein